MYILSFFKSCLSWRFLDSFLLISSDKPKLVNTSPVDQNFGESNSYLKVQPLLNNWNHEKSEARDFAIQATGLRFAV